MGNSHSSEIDADGIAMDTHFTADEVRELLKEFKMVSPNLAPISQKKFGELCVLMATRYPGSVYSDPEWRQVVFSYSDTDHSKTVDVQEAIACLSVMTHGSLAEKASLVFTSFDKDGNGTLSKAEIQRGFETSFACLQTAITKAVRVTKEEHKGSPPLVKKLSQKSFSSKSLFGEWVKMTVDTFFNEVDTDSNGAISREEFIAATEQEGIAGVILGILLDPVSEKAHLAIDKMAELQLQQQLEKNQIPSPRGHTSTQEKSDNE